MSHQSAPVWGKLISMRPDQQNIFFSGDTNEYLFNNGWKIYQNTNGETIITNLSAWSIHVDDTLLESNQKKKLFGGERLRSFHPNSDSKFDYIFCFMDFQRNLKRDRDEIRDCEHLKKLTKFENDLQKELACPICTNFLEKCMILTPCLHTFCSFCLFDFLKLSSQCPLCRVEAISVAKNSVLSNMTQLITENFPPLQKAQERKQLELIDLTGVIVRDEEGVYVGSYLNKKDGYGKYVFKTGTIYEGDWKNDKSEGKGTILFEDGDKYEGSWLNGRFHGIGKYTWEDGREYEGGFQENYSSGYGIMKYEDEKIYKGNWRNDNKEGNGILIFPNGDRYEGKWVKNNLQSKVKIEYSNGQKYEGEIDVESLERQGRGTLILNNGDKYQGNWINDVLELEVQIDYPNGDKYEGEIDVVSLKKQGKGVLILNNGDKYRGIWIHNVLQPHVLIEYLNGDKYEGKINIENFKKQGKGVLISSEGDQYDGNWVNDQQHGHGRYVWKKNKLIYEGLWEEGKMKGDGVMTYADGTRFKAQFKKL